MVISLCTANDDLVAVNSKDLYKLESEITCCICHEYYAEPILLPCLHCYCKNCILKLEQSTIPGKTLCCPECRREVKSVDSLKNAFHMNRLTSVTIPILKACNKVENCQSCVVSSKAVAYCQKCSFICSKCFKLHSELKDYVTHKYASFEVLRQEDWSLDTDQILDCQVHNKPFILYCINCDCLICEYCTLKDHKDHLYEFTKKCAPDARTKLSEDIEPLKSLHNTLIEREKKSSENITRLEEQDLAAIIRTKFAKLYDFIKQKEQETVELATTVSRKRLQNLSHQKDTLSQAIADIQRIIGTTEECVGHYTDNEVMSMNTDIRKEMAHKLEEHSKLMEKPLVQEEDVKIKVVHDPTLCLSYVDGEVDDFLDLTCYNTK